MEAAVDRGAASPGLPPPFDPIHIPDISEDAADVSPVNFDAPASSHEDDDPKESDRWRLNSDTSTISSRVTTPDPVTSSPLLLPFAPASVRTPMASRVSTLPSSPLLPPAIPPIQGMERGRGRGYGRGRGRGRFIPKGPNGAARHRSSPMDSPRYDPPRPPLPRVDLARLPPPPSPANKDRHPNGDGYMNRVSYPLSRPTTSYKRESPTARGHFRSVQVSHVRGHTEQLVQPISWPQNDQTRSRPPRSRRNSRRSQPARRRSNDSEDESVAPSLTQLEDDASGSSASSDEDPIAYRNARQFPPQLPAGPAYGSSAPRSRSSATNQIAAWVSRYEKSQSPVRSRLGEISLGMRQADTDSRPDGSLGSNTSSHGEIELLWQQLKEKRAKLNEIKAEMRVRRRELRDKRREKDAADNAFMGVIRPMLVSQGGLRHTSANLLEPRLEKMQRLRDDYQVLESNYENLEVVLDEEEAELSILETRFFSNLAAGQTKAERQSDMPREPEAANFSDDSEIPYELRGISRDGPSEDPHPLYVELTSAIGDLVNADEEYEDLYSARERYEYEQQLKKATGQKASDEAKEFFDEFPSEESRMREAVTKLDAEVKRLKKLCEDRGVMKKHLSVQMEYALDPHMKYEDMELDDKETIQFNHKTLAHSEFNELLSQPDHVLGEPEPLTPLGALRAATRLPNDHPEKGLRKRLASKEYAIDSLMRDCDGGKKADYVNRWLLHQLRLSPLNAVLLRSTFLASRSLKIRDMWRWQCDVMHYWWRDNTMLLTDGFSNPITSNDSEYSSRLGTPQLSRAASDGDPRLSHQPHHTIDNSDAMTVHG